MKTPTALSVTSSQREQTSLRSQVPRLPRSNVCSTRDLENRSASVHRKRFSTPSLTLKFLCAGKLNPRGNFGEACLVMPEQAANRAQKPRMFGQIPGTMFCKRSSEQFADPDPTASPERSSE